MRKENEKRILSQRILSICFLLLIVAGTLIISCRSSESSADYKKNHPSAKEVNMGLPNFVPGNNDVIIFNYSTFLSWSKIATYNLKMGELRPFDHIQIRQITFPKFSPNGKKIVFTGSLDEDNQNRNIYIMNADGSSIRQLTNFDFSKQKHRDLEMSNFVIGPSFSPDGKRIIYAKSRFKRGRAFPLRGTKHDAWDVYEVDLATGTEHRLTNYDFYEMSWPYYMPDGKRFIFSAMGPVNPKGRGPKDFREYEKLYQKNFIFIMDGINNELKPAFTYGSNSTSPCVMPDGAIIFLSETSAKDSPKSTQELFIYKNGQLKQLTYLGSWIELATVSDDGKRIMFTKKSDNKAHGRSKWLMNSDGTGIKEIKIPPNLLK